MSTQQIVDANGAIHSGTNGQFTGHLQSEGDTAAVLPPIVNGSRDVDDMFGTVERLFFSQAAIDQQHQLYQNSKSRSARVAASERCSLIRTRRLAMLVADRFPGATGVEIEDAYQGDSECFVNAVILADGTRADYVDELEELNDEACDIYDNNDGWKGVAEADGDAWVIDIAKAMQIYKNTLSKGYF